MEQTLIFSKPISSREELKPIIHKLFDGVNETMNLKLNGLEMKLEQQTMSNEAPGVTALLIEKKKGVLAEQRRLILTEIEKERNNALAEIETSAFELWKSLSEGRRRDLAESFMRERISEFEKSLLRWSECSVMKLGMEPPFKRSELKSISADLVE